MTPELEALWKEYHECKARLFSTPQRFEGERAALRNRIGELSDAIRRKLREQPEKSGST